MINKTEAYLKEEEKESLENNDVRKEDKMYGRRWVLCPEINW